MRSSLLMLVLVVGSPALARPDRALQALPMDGPYATLADICRSQDEDAKVCAAAPRHCGAAGQRTQRVAAPFLEARVIEWPGACDVALRTEAGWWLPAWKGLHPLQRFLHNGERYDSVVDGIAGTADGAVVVRGTFVHWTAPEKMAWLRHPRLDEWYECEARVMVCAVGAGGAPSCTAPVASSYTTYCRSAEPPHRKLRQPVAGADFHWDVHVTRRELRLDGAPERLLLQFP